MSAAFVAGFPLNKRRSCVVQRSAPRKWGLRASLSGFEAVRFEQYFAAGGICALLTHSALTPVDVVKTRLQTRPGAYSNAIDAVRSIVQFEGGAALLTGLGATAGGYFMHGALKYSFYELLLDSLASSAIAALGAELVASMALCPLEAIRIRAVADNQFPRSVLIGLVTVVRDENVCGLYKGLPSLLLRQVPFTVAQFVAFEWMRRVLVTMTGWHNGVTIDFFAGLLAGFAAAIASHPGDTILSRVNKDNRNFGLNIVTPGELFVGLAPRLLWVSCLIASQLVIYDSIKLCMSKN